MFSYSSSAPDRRSWLLASSRWHCALLLNLAAVSYALYVMKNWKPPFHADWCQQKWKLHYSGPWPFLRWYRSFRIQTLIEGHTLRQCWAPPPSVRLEDSNAPLGVGPRNPSCLTRNGDSNSRPFGTIQNSVDVVLGNFPNQTGAEKEKKNWLIEKKKFQR